MRTLRYSTRPCTSRILNASALNAVRRQQIRFNTSDTSSDATPTTQQQHNTEPPQRKRFSSSVNFKVAADKVDSDNCPSASEIKEILPTADELYQQLPTPAEIRQMYGLDRPGAGRAPPTPDIYASAGVMASLKRSVLGGMSKDSDLNKDGTNDVNSPPDQTTSTPRLAGLGRYFDRLSMNPSSTSEGPHVLSRPPNNGATQAPANNNGADEALWPDCDTPEDIINDERYGGEGEEAPAPKGEHIMLAWKALMYGTLAAFVLTISIAISMSWYMGFSSFAQIKEHLQTRKAREVEKLRQEAIAKRIADKRNGTLEDTDDEDTVHVYEIDLTQPTTLMSQLDGLVKLVEDLAVMEEEKERARQSGSPSDKATLFNDNAADKVPAPVKPTKRTYSL